MKILETERLMLKTWDDNDLQPASLSIPIISGPLLHNFIAIRDLLLQHDT